MSKNTNLPPVLEANTLEAYLEEYSNTLSSALKGIDQQALHNAQKAMEEASKNNKQIFVAGNGGSAAISNHLCCDWTKGTYISKDVFRIRTQSLSTNNAVLTAYANDYCYEDVFAKQIEHLANTGDCLVLISSSGNSENIIRAAKEAKKLNMTTIGLSGFKGGRLKDEADISLHVNFDNYGIVEDAHQAIMHILAQYTAKSNFQKL